MNVNSNTCSSSNTTTTKCNKNLGIVVECIENNSVTNTDESQALLLNSGQNSKRKMSDRLMEGNTNKMANTNVVSILRQIGEVKEVLFLNFGDLPFCS